MHSIYAVNSDFVYTIQLKFVPIVTYHIFHIIREISRNFCHLEKTKNLSLMAENMSDFECVKNERKSKVWQFPLAAAAAPLSHQCQLSNKRRVLLVCHKNKWRDLSQKFVTSLFKTMFLFIEGGQENIFIGPKNIFDQ